MILFEKILPETSQYGRMFPTGPDRLYLMQVATVTNSCSGVTDTEADNSEYDAYSIG